jgi:hypothetical protein
MPEPRCLAGFWMRRQNYIPMLCKIDGTIGIYALTNRIRLTSSPQVVEAADTVCRIIVDTYLAPNMTLEGMRANWIDKHVDPLRDFSEACRQELQTFGRY